MIRCIDEHKDRFGVEGICRVLGEQLECGFITASGYWAAKRRQPAARTVSDRQLVPILERLHAANYGVYGVRKMWWLLNREGHQVGRDRVARLMRAAGLRGVVRGRKVFTTRGDDRDQRPEDLVQRRFSAAAPNRLWVADLTYVRTWAGFCYVAFVVDVYSRMIVGWATSSTMRTEDLPLVALETAAWVRVGSLHQLIHHSDRGAVNNCRFATPTGSPSSASPVRSVAAETASTTRSPSPSTGAVQDRTNQTPRALAQRRAGRTRHPGMGRLVEPPPPPHRVGRSESSRTRNRLPSRSTAAGPGRSHTNRTSLNPSAVHRSPHTGPATSARFAATPPPPRPPPSPSGHH